MALTRWVRDEALNYDADLTLMSTQPSGMLTQLVEASGDEIRGLDSLILKARLSETLAVELRSDFVVLGAFACRIACIRNALPHRCNFTLAVKTCSFSLGWGMMKYGTHGRPKLELARPSENICARLRLCKG